MIDIQSSPALLSLPINKVGIKSIRHPVDVFINKTEKQATIATFAMYTNLSSTARGSHMSRFVEILNQKKWALSLPCMQEIMTLTKDKLKSDNAYIQAQFDVCIEKTAPVSKSIGVIDYQVDLHAKTQNNKQEFSLKVAVPITTLCPCSKEISEYGAHNQRTYVTVTIQTDTNIYITEIINLVEKSASAEVYSVIKRADEKYITEQAYNNPKFVEDVVREIADNLASLTRANKITNYTVEAQSVESIHNHDAYAMITSIAD